MIRVVKVDPGAEPVVTDINNSLEAMQAVVGGGCIEEIFREAAHVGRWMTYLCNEDPAGLRPNRHLGAEPFLGRVSVRGPILVSATDDGGETVSMTDAEIRLALRTVANWPKISDEAPAGLN
jgi:hypothetical protein